MPLADDALEVLATALRDPSVVLRYQEMIVTVPGSECLWWRGAVSGRGHGRFYVGTVPVTCDLEADVRVVEGAGGEGGEGQDGSGRRELCMIAHRFGYALAYGAAALNTVPVFGHGCDNALCQRIGAGHAQPSSHAQNRRAFLARRSVVGNPLGDARGARRRSRELRDLTRANPAAVAADQARLLRLGLQLPLFDG